MLAIDTATIAMHIAWLPVATQCWNGIHRWHDHRMCHFIVKVHTHHMPGRMCVCVCDMRMGDEANCHTCAAHIMRPLCTVHMVNVLRYRAIFASRPLATALFLTRFDPNRFLITFAFRFVIAMRFIFPMTENSMLHNNHIISPQYVIPQTICYAKQR